MKCDYEATATGTIELWLSEVDDLTPEGVEEWLREGAEIDISKQNPPVVTLEPSWTKDQLANAIRDEKKRREG